MRPALLLFLLSGCGQLALPAELSGAPSRPAAADLAPGAGPDLREAPADLRRPGWLPPGSRCTEPGTLTADGGPYGQDDCANPRWPPFGAPGGDVYSGCIGDPPLSGNAQCWGFYVDATRSCWTVDQEWHCSK